MDNALTERSGQLYARFLKRHRQTIYIPFVFLATGCIFALFAAMHSDHKALRFSVAAVWLIGGVFIVFQHRHHAKQVGKMLFKLDEPAEKCENALRWRAKWFGK